MLTGLPDAVREAMASLERRRELRKRRPQTAGGDIDTCRAMTALALSFLPPMGSRTDPPGAAQRDVEGQPRTPLLGDRGQVYVTLAAATRFAEAQRLQIEEGQTRADGWSYSSPRSVRRRPRRTALPASIAPLAHHAARP